MAAGKRSGREIFLMVLLGAAVIWALWYLARDKPVGAPGAGSDDEKPAWLSDDAPRVRMDLLAGQAEPYDPNGRDLFKYARRPSTRAELQALKKKPVVKKPPPKPSVRRPPVVRKSPKPAGPVPPRIPFTYIGRLGTMNDRIAVFEEGEEIHLARQGEMVGKDFRVVDIDYETVVIGYTDPKFEKLTKTLNQTDH